MANTTLELLLQVKDKASSQIKSASKNIGASFDSIAKSAQIAGGAMIAVGGAITAVTVTSVKAAQEQERAEARLAQIARQVTGANDEQIDSFKRLASEMQQVGVIGDEVIIAGQSQIASFTKSSEVVAELSDDLADLAVATYGSNVTQEQSIQTANLLGKALQGQLGALTRTGILVNDEFKAAFEAANTEQERAAILSKIVQDNYGGLNAAARETAEGGLQAMKNALGDLQENIGQALSPIIVQAAETLSGLVARIQEWREQNPELFNQIVKIVAVIGGLMVVLGPLLVMLPGIVSAFGVLGGALSLLTGPFGIVAAAIAGLIIWLTQNREVLNGLIEKIKEMNILQTLRGWFDAVMQGVQNLWNTLQEMGIIDQVKDAFLRIWEAIMESLWPALVNLWETFKPFLPFFGTLAKAVGVVLYGAFIILMKGFQLAIQTASFLINAFAEMANILRIVLTPAIWTVEQGIKAFTWAFEGLGKMIGWVIQQVSNLIGLFNKLLSFTKKEGGDGLFKSIGNAIGNVFGGNRAVGGSVMAGRAYQVGENGPEMFVPSTNGRIVPNGAGGGVGIVVNITGNNISNNMDLDEIATTVGDRILRNLQSAYTV